MNRGMKPWLLLAALPLLGGCVALADYGQDPYAVRYQQPAYPGWWGQDAASVNIFFGALGPYGRWDRHPGFGQVWYPGGLGRGWQPYSRGHWANDPRYGRRWVSHDPFGFATDHYGRWNRDPARGWYWVPGTRFQPGWSAPPPGWRPPATNYTGWRPPVTNETGRRQPVTNETGWRQPVTNNPGWRSRADRPANRPRADRPANRPPRMDQAGSRPPRADQAGNRPPSADLAASRPPPADLAGSRPPRVDRPASRPPRAAPPASSARISPRDTTGGPVRED